MILRKPYAFLIKYFKIINLVIAALTIYIGYRTFGVTSFFNNYVAHNYTGNFYEGFANQYISSFLYIIIILIIVGILGITILFINKKKPAKAYIVSIIYYVILIIFLMIIKGVMTTLETEAITAENARVFRDLTLILFAPQIGTILLLLYRGFGFNIKSFGFENDLKELQITEEDNEEFELTFKGDNVKIKRNTRRFFREFGYYVEENKLIVTVISIIVGILLIIFIQGFLPKIIDHNYGQGDNFVSNSISYRFEDSIVTNLDYRGNKIPGNKYYVVVKYSAENPTSDDIKVDYNNFRLIIDDNYIYPNSDKEIYFIDYAYTSSNKIVRAKSSQNYSVVFEIDESYVRKNYRLKVNNGVIYVKKEKKGSYNYIDLTPIVISDNNLEKVANLDEEISFTNSNLLNTTLKVSNASITDQYYYSYEMCIKDKCDTYKGVVNVDKTTTKKTLLVLDYEYKPDENALFIKRSDSANSFFSTFAKIKYTDESGVIYYENVENITPETMKGKVALKVTSKIKTAEELSLIINIRNKEYEIKIK